MSRRTNANDYLFGRRETGLIQTKYLSRGAAAFRTLSPNTSSSSDSCEDSFDQICKPFRKPVIPTDDSDTTTMQREGYSMVRSSSDKNKFGQEECDELDELFKNIDLKDTIDKIPSEWLEQNDEHPLPANNVGLSTVYEGSESNYRSTKSVNLSSISKDSANFELSADSLINFIKSSENSKDSLDRSYVTSGNVLPIELNDTLEDVEYVCDEKNRYLLKPVSKATKNSSTNDEPEYVSADSSVIVVDSSPDTSFVTAQNELKLIDVKDIKTETLSVKSSLSYCTLTSVDSNTQTSSECTVSSTRVSFTTAKNDFKLIDSDDIKSEYSCDKTSTDGKSNSWSTLDTSANVSTAPMIDLNDSLFAAKTKLKSTECSDDGKSETSGEGQMFTCITYPKTASFFEDNEEKTIDSDVGKSSEYFTAVASNDSSTSTNHHLSVSAARYNTLDDVPSFTTDSTVSSVCRSNIPQNFSSDSGKHFNDSLDRIEYMMKKGRELQEKTYDKPSPSRAVNSPVAQYKAPTPKALPTSSQKRIATGPKTPVVKAKPFISSAKKTQPSPQAVTPSTRILKPFNRPQSAKSQPAERKLTPSRASPIISPAFKKPILPTSGTKKEPAQSRIPTSKNFNHIVSPIGAYIKNIAAPPLLANVKPTSDFFDSSYCNKMSKELDQSVMSEAGASKPTKLVSSLPVKFFTSSQQQRVIDEKFQKIPGGEKLNRIIGQMPSVISHQGRIHSGNPVKRIVPTDDSFANVSVMSGDISVQVVRDVKRQ